MKKSCSLAKLETTCFAPFCPTIEDKAINLWHERQRYALPPPAQFVKQAPQQSCLSLSISAQRPYTIISASNQLCEVLQIRNDQIQGRRLSVIFGPETNQPALLTAIKNIGLAGKQNAASIHAIKIYGQDQKVHMMKVRCHLPTCRIARSMQQLVLEFEKIDIALSKQFVDRSSKDMHLRKAFRSRYNFLTGLEVHLEYCRTRDKVVSDQHIRDTTFGSEFIDPCFLEMNSAIAALSCIDDSATKLELGATSKLHC